MSPSINRFCLTEEEFKNYIPTIPTHGLFRNLVGSRSGRLEVVKYYDKRGKGHRYLCNCDCGKKYIIVPASSLSAGVQSCGCYNRERTRETAIGNKRGSASKTPIEEKLKRLAVDNPTYIVVDARDELVMSKWVFYCTECNETFECVYSNTLKYPHADRPQKACSCSSSARLKKEKSTYFYILEVNEGYSGFRKFGITNNFDKRLETHARKINNGIYPILVSEASTREHVKAIESIFKYIFTDKIEDTFEGHTETFRCMSDREILSLYFYLLQLNIEELKNVVVLLKELNYRTWYSNYKGKQ